MAATLTVLYRNTAGTQFKVGGTWSAAAGENTASWTGFDIVTDYEFKFDQAITTSGVKAVYVNPTLTITFEDLPAAATGTWSVEGH